MIREIPGVAGPSWEVVPSLEHLFSNENAPDILALDIPIGLPMSGARDCDLEARRLLGRGRASSVFPAPIRPILEATSHKEGSEARFKVEGKRLSIQAWAIIPKIREVDNFLRGQPADQLRVREVHPEVCFYYMAGERPMAVAKKRKAGRDERANLLRMHFGNAVDRALADRRILGCAADDILDAFAGLWTGRRIQAGTARQIPLNPPGDMHGLRMEMLA